MKLEDNRQKRRDLEARMAKSTRWRFVAMTIPAVLLVLVLVVRRLVLARR